MSDGASCDLVVVSAFGRGDWLANEFATRGWRVSLLDATAQLGSFDERDIEGPFGLLEGADLYPSQRARLVDEGEFAPVASGFTLWLPEGPLELRSELTPFLLRAREIPYDVEAYLRQPDHETKESERERRALKRLQYSRSWLAQFAHSIASASHHENYIALEADSVAPLFTQYGLRQLTAAGTAKGAQTSQSLGVQVKSRVELQEFAFDGKYAVTIKYRDHQNKERAETARAFVWCLTFEETKFISDALVRSLFPQNWPEAPWAWQRISFDVTSGAEVAGQPSTDVLSQIPLAAAVFEDVDLAWTRANLILLRRREGESRIDAWVKVPTWMRREHEAFDQVRTEVRENLSRKLAGASLREISSGPTPLIWPIWSQEEFTDLRGKLAPKKSPNVFYDSPGVWTSLDWMGRFRHENEIVTKLEKLKTQWDAATRKAEAAAQRRGPRA